MDSTRIGTSGRRRLPQIRSKASHNTTNAARIALPYTRRLGRGPPRPTGEPLRSRRIACLRCTPVTDVNSSKINPRSARVPDEYRPNNRPHQLTTRRHADPRHHCPKQNPLGGTLREATHQPSGAFQTRQCVLRRDAPVGRCHPSHCLVVVREQARRACKPVERHRPEPIASDVACRRPVAPGRSFVAGFRQGPCRISWMPRTDLATGSVLHSGMGRGTANALSPGCSNCPSQSRGRVEAAG